MGLEEVLKKLVGKPLLKEFAEWLHKNEYYEEESIESLLCEEWDGAYPTVLLSDDLLVDIGNFLYYMAEFAVVKVYGKDWWKISGHYIRIVPDPSYEGRSYIYVLELETKTVLVALDCGKTWNFNPKIIEDELNELMKQLEESKRLLAVRKLTST